MFTRPWTVDYRRTCWDLLRLIRVYPVFLAIYVCTKQCVVERGRVEAVAGTRRDFF